MKKKIILIIIIILFFGNTVYRYHIVNTKYPDKTTIECQQGEWIEFVPGIDIQTRKIQFISPEKTEEMIEQTEMYSSTAKHKLVDIVIKVKNKTAEEQQVGFENIQLECGGSSSCIYLTLINTTTNRYSNLGVTLMPGEERECIFPVLLANSTFSNNDWKHLEDKLYWLTFSDYPVKTKLYF